MKFSFIGLLFILFIFSSSCEEKNEICECFETRLAIKDLLNTSENTLVTIKSEEYQKLKIKKEECMTTIEPKYFLENGIERNGRSDKEFLLDELGDCEAVKKLLEAN